MLKPQPAAEQQFSPTDQAGPQVLIVFADQQIKDFARDLMARTELRTSLCLDCQAAVRQELLTDVDVVIVSTGQLSDIGRNRLAKFLMELCSRSIATIVVSPYSNPDKLPLPKHTETMEKIQWTGPDTSADELWGRICTLLDFRPIINRIEAQLGQVEQWTQQMSRRFEELHEELRLAWRVQQDFLPKQLPEVGKLTFKVLYRPASWVSGDIYDVFQLDERHVGFYVADVVGHGVAAGLMTMFIKRALITKLVYDGGYDLVPPDQALALLNKDLADQDLPYGQFVTVGYFLINAFDLKASFARGGHPEPILLDPDGKWRKLQADGPLLGVFQEADFQAGTAMLKAGQKILLFSDGLEAAFRQSNQDGDQWLQEHLISLANLPADQFIHSVEAKLDCQASSLHPEDDITLVVMEASD